MNELTSEAAGLLAALIRARSCNPPGNETAAACVLGAYLREAGIGYEVYEAAPGRANLVARIRGSGGSPSLLLLSHLDTVDADPGEWSVDPWEGVIQDGSLWGRGTLDLKGQIAAQAVAVASLLREGAVLGGDVILAATADEECGSAHGTRWLLDTHPDALRSDFALTHGAGDRITVGDRVVYFCATAERAKSGLTVTLRTPAALSMLVSNANAIVKAAELTASVAGQHVGETLLEEVAVVIRSLTGADAAPEAVGATAGAIHPALATLLAPLTGATFVPTRIESFLAEGRPSACEIDFDCWLLPGQDRSEAEGIVSSGSGGTAHRLSWRPARGGSRSPRDTVLWDAIESFVQGSEPSSVLLPLCDAGFTDSHWLRAGYGTVAYGFFPMREMTTQQAASCVHGPDERLPLNDLELQIAFYRHVITAVCGAHLLTRLVHSYAPVH